MGFAPQYVRCPPWQSSRNVSRGTFRSSRNIGSTVYLFTCPPTAYALHTLPLFLLLEWFTYIFLICVETSISLRLFFSFIFLLIVVIFQYEYLIPRQLRFSFSFTSSFSVISHCSFLSRPLLGTHPYLLVALVPDAPTTPVPTLSKPNPDQFITYTEPSNDS